MKISNIFTYFKATVKVEVEGFFIERFINLCKINNIKIWEILFINSGRIEFLTTPNEYKKLKPFLKKTKCTSKIIERKGIYFELFRYRKRRNIIALTIISMLLWIILSTFIWDINITGNKKISSNEIIKVLKETNVAVGKNKLFISTEDTAEYMRERLYDIAWVGLKFNGTRLDLKVIEKIIEDNNDDPSIMGNIVSKKSGIITKIIAKDGTALFKTGSYIQAGMVAIEGSIKSEFVEEKRVHASGILKARVEYKFEKEYKYEENVKEYTGKRRYGIGLGTNNKKNVLKCLIKENKYDISSKEKVFNVFGTKISFIFNTYNEYKVIKNQYSFEKLINKGKNDSGEYIKKLINDETKLLKEETNIIKTSGGIKYIVSYELEENIGKFIKAGE